MLRLASQPSVAEEKITPYYVYTFDQRVAFFFTFGCANNTVQSIETYQHELQRSKMIIVYTATD